MVSFVEFVLHCSVKWWFFSVWECMELQYFVCDVSRVNNCWIYWLRLWFLDGVINDFGLLMDNSFYSILRYWLEINRMESKYRSYGTLQFGCGMLRHLPQYTALFVSSYVHPITGSLCSIKISFNLSCICVTIFQDSFSCFVKKKFFPHFIVLTDVFCGGPMWLCMEQWSYLVFYFKHYIKCWVSSWFEKFQFLWWQTWLIDQITMLRLPCSIFLKARTV